MSCYESGLCSSENPVWKAVSMVFLLTCSISFVEVVFKSALVPSPPKRQGIR